MKKADKKPRADSKLKNLPTEQQAAIWELMHPQTPDTTPWTLDAVAVFCQERLGFSTTLSSLSEWRSWYQLGRRMDAASNRANQTAIELARNSDLSPEDIERVAQTVFTAETLEQGNVKGYVALAKLRLASKAQAMDERKLALLEANAREAKAKLLAMTTAAKSTGGLTPETLRQIEEAAGLL